MRFFLLALLLLSTSSYAHGSYNVDPNVEQTEDECSHPHEGVVCIKFVNQDHAVKFCKFRAQAGFVDSITGQSKYVRGYNSTLLLGFQSAKVCFDFRDQLKLIDPWTGEILDTEWDLINLNPAASVFCRTAT